MRHISSSEISSATKSRKLLYMGSDTMKCSACPGIQVATASWDATQLRGPRDDGFRIGISNGIDLDQWTE